MIIVSVVTLKIFKTRFTFYQKQLKKINKNYGDVIVEITSSIEKEKYKEVFVKSFEELIDLQEEVRVPINFYELVKNKEAEFSIIYSDHIYLYIIKEPA